MRRKNLHLVGYGLLVALPCVLMAGPLLRGAIPNFMDPVMYFFPLRVHAARLLHGGEWPWWNRCLMGGMPLFENPQAALAYPFHWPFLAWPNGFWFLLPLLLQLGLYAALTAWALRRIGAGRAAWFGGALALAGSYGWSRLQYGNYLNILPWWPLWLGAAHAYAADGRRRWLAWGTVALSLGILGGAHQLAAYGLVLLAIDAVVQMSLSPGDRLRWLRFLCVTFVLALLVAAPGWLPQWGFIRETSRPGGLDTRAVLDGTIGSFAELFKALAGDWALPFKPGAWVDAEVAVALGPLALLLACWMPRRGPLRRAWAGCWIAALIAIVLSLRPVMSALLDLSAAAGLFHGPRRWLGAAQWFLILASALSAASLLQLPAKSRRDERFQPATPVAGRASHEIQSPAGTAGPIRAIQCAIGAILFAALLSPAYLTWRTVDLATRPAGELLHPRPAPLLLQAGLRPGERFFVADYLRDNSYNYRRPDLTDWALPNFSMLWGVEDLGGYEPAQTAAYARFIRQIHEAEPWRQPYPAHFGLIQNPRASAAFDAGNVRAAIMPRWGVPMFFRPIPDRPEFSVAPGPWREASLRAIVSGPPQASARLIALSGDRQQVVGETLLHPVSLADDQVATTASAIARPQPPNPRNVVCAQFDTDNVPADRWVLQLGPNRRLIDAYAWGAPDAALWQPVAMAGVATLMRYRGTPEYVTAAQGEFPIAGQEIRANKVTIRKSDLATGLMNPARSLVIHDAWWPGWRAAVDGKPVAIRKDGLWRRIDLTPMAVRVEMFYHPPLLRPSLLMCIAGIVCLAAIGRFYRTRER